MGRIADYLRRMDWPGLFVCVAKTRLEQSNVHRLSGQDQLSRHADMTCVEPCLQIVIKVTNVDDFANTRI